MPTTQQLVQKYEDLEDLELMVIHHNIEEYAPEAKEALSRIIKNRGGLDRLQLRLRSIEERETEIARIRSETEKLFKRKATLTEISAQITPLLLTHIEKDRLIARTISALELEVADTTIKPRTVVGGIMGGLIGGTIGGIVWGLQLIYSGHMMMILAIGMVMLSYAFIRLFTRQSKKNKVVLLITALSSVYALVLGQILFEIIGYQGS